MRAAAIWIAMLGPEIQANLWECLAVTIETPYLTSVKEEVK